MKKNFKRITSFVLSAMMLGGASSIMTNAASTTIESVTEGSNTAGPYLVKGYSTGGGKSYYIDVYFDNAAIYCYNKGVYDPTDSKYYVTEGQNIDNKYLEKGKSFTGAEGEKKIEVTGSGAWFGFDGTQNLITVVNRSNAAVDCKVTSAANAGTAAIAVYEENSAQWYTSVGLTQYTDETSTEWVYSDFNTGGAFETKLTDAAGTGSKVARAAHPFGTSSTALTSEDVVDMAAAGKIGRASCRERV